VSEYTAAAVAAPPHCHSRRRTRRCRRRCRRFVVCCLHETR